MRKKEILLSEAQFFNLIKKIVKEAKKEKENNEDKISKDEAIDLIADFFKKEVLPELSNAEKNKLKMKVDGKSSSRLGERYLSEEDDDEEDDKDSRKSNFKEKVMMRGGGLMAAAGVVGVIGRSMGWTDSEVTTKIYEYIEKFGAGEYSGPITVAMIVAGLTMAFKGRADKYKRTGK